MPALRSPTMRRTDTASRVMAAPPDRVYAALTDPHALTTWLPPTGMTGRFDRFDLRPGGSYRLVLTYDDPTMAKRSGLIGLQVQTGVGKISYRNIWLKTY